MENTPHVHLVDISREKSRHVIIAAGTPDVYQGHPHTLLMPDGRTIFCVWTYNHGGACGPMKRSDDGGLSWSELLPVPENWSTVINCPTIHRLTDPDGRARLLVFAGNGDMYQSVSEDDGATFSPMAPNGLKCVVAPMSVLSAGSTGAYHMWYHRGRAGKSERHDKSDVGVYQSTSYDGGVTWPDTKLVCEVKGAVPCEPTVVESPDESTLVLLIRENTRTMNSLTAVSRDRGATWTEPVELPAELTGDRHCAAYAPDGRLVVVMRDMAAESPTKGSFVGWVGSFDDLPTGGVGQYRLKLLHQYGERSSDCGYPGLEILPDGTFVATTYVKYEPGPEQNSVVAVRFRLDELDDRL